MYSITDLKKGTVIQLNGTPYRVIKYDHSSLGRGGAVVRTKLKNLLDGSVLSKTFRGSDKIEPANIHPEAAQYLYSDDIQAHFMLSSSYEQVAIDKKLITDKTGFLTEGSEVTLLYIDNRPVNIELPIKIELAVTSADPGIKGDTVGSTLKSCQLETGLNVQVPLFIKAGDRIRVDTRTGEYVERV